MKVKIIGAGSAGIHLAQACRRMGWEVFIVDIDKKAFQRIQDIYNKRYQSYGETWENARIGMRVGESVADCRNNDIIMIATPPDVRMKLALEAIKENPKLLHLEKPLCTPDLKGVAEFEAEMKNHPDTIVTVGYDHAVSESIFRVRELLNENRIEERNGGGQFGGIITIDVEFREHWEGALTAHSWLRGPEDSYLGYWRRGGGAGNEHSHALHLYLKLAEWSWWWPTVTYGVHDSKCMMSFEAGPKSSEYDKLFHLLIQMKNARIGRVTQDVVTKPPKKWARIQGTKGWLEWHCNGDPVGDVVKHETELKRGVEIFPKKRPDDFFAEIQHYAILLNGEKHCESPLSYRSGREVMGILNKAYYSQ